MEELSIEGIKAACEKHFSSSLECKGMSCDILAGAEMRLYFTKGLFLAICYFSLTGFATSAPIHCSSCKHSIDNFYTH